MYMNYLVSIALVSFVAVLPTVANVHSNTLLTTVSGAEPGEHLSGGATTSLKTANRNAFSHASANLSFADELNFKVGNGIFKKIWVSAPASTTSSDGLGPLFNAKSCQRCHIRDGRGHPPSANWPGDTAVSMFLRLSIPPQNDADREALSTYAQSVIPEPTYGTQLQDFAIQGHKPEGRMFIEYKVVKYTLDDGEVVELRTPHYTVQELGYGPMHPETMLSPRIAPPMIGLGLLEKISQTDILAKADPHDEDGDGISGRPNWFGEDKQLGRFGWKAGMPSLDQQNQAAFAGDIGISTPLSPHPAGDCSTNQVLCKTAPNGNSDAHGGFEAGAKLTDLVLFYTRNLAVPVRRNVDNPIVLRGKKLFQEMECASCHTPHYVTSTSSDDDHLGGQHIWPYTDMLLHDMGEGLADNRPEGAANGREWRTPPLWGIGLTKVVNGHEFFLHDGRARGFLEAILWHGGEATSSRDRFAALTKAQRDSLIAFLESL